MSIFGQKDLIRCRDVTESLILTVRFSYLSWMMSTHIVLLAIPQNIPQEEKETVSMPAYFKSEL